MEGHMDQKGFTLLETMMVVAVLCIILSISGISIYTIINNKLNSYALELTWDIRKIRYQSLTEGNTDAHIRCMEEGYIIVDDSKIIKRVQFLEPYKIIGGGMFEEICFTQKGVPIHPQTIQIKNTYSGEVKKITIVVNTGRILLYE